LDVFLTVSAVSAGLFQTIQNMYVQKIEFQVILKLAEIISKEEE